MIDTLLGNKSFILGFSAGFLATILLFAWQQKEVSGKEMKPHKHQKKKDPCKMVLVVRKDLKSTKREVVTHCVQACIEVYKLAHSKHPDLLKYWYRYGAAKIALKVNSEADLIAIKKEADKRDIVNYLLEGSDASKKSALVLAIGPDMVGEIDAITGHLKLF